MYTNFSLKVSFVYQFPTRRASMLTTSLQYTFLAFLIVFEAGSAICGAAQSSRMLIAGRTIAGLGGSGLRNGALTIVSESIPWEQRPRKLRSFFVSFC